jgi:hypothetical protein
LLRGFVPRNDRFATLPALTVITARCREAFKEMAEKMRYIKARYFHSPPLTESDFASLLLNKPDTSSSEIPLPNAQPTADLSFPGIHLVELSNIRPLSGTPPDPRADYGVRIHWGLSGEPTEMNRFRVTRRRKERFDFDGESGNRVYFCLKYENPSGKEGSFGPILSASIS